MRARQFTLKGRLAPAVLLVLAAVVLWPNSLDAQGEGDRKRILLLFTHESHLPPQVILEQSLRSTLQAGSLVPLEIYSEYLDAVRTTVGEYEEELVLGLARKYGGKKFDLIFVVNPPALRILLRNRSALWPETPIIFLVLEKRSLADLELGTNVTGIWGENNFGPNLELALALHPKTKQVVVVSGVSEWDQYWRAKVVEDFRAFEGKVEFSYITGLSISEQQQALASLPQQAIVFLMSSTRDNVGNNYNNLEVVSKVSPASSVPVYGISDAQLGLGIVGGKLMSFEAFGVAGANIGLRVLRGEKPETIAPHGIPSVAMFDWRELQRWGISEKSLPSGSIVRFRVPSFWDQYKWYAIVGIFVIMIQSALIVGMVINRVWRRRAERALGRSEQKNRDIVRALPDLMFVQTSDGVYLDYHASDRNELLKAPEEFLGKSMRDVMPAELAEALFSCLRRAKETGEVQVAEYSLSIHGALRWYEARIIHTDSDQFLSIVRDITERKHAEEAVRESEARFRNMADTAPVMIWVAGPDKRCTYFNKRWLDFTGRTINEELGNGWAEGVHPGDYDRCVETYNSAFDLHVPFTMEYRLRRADGEFRWLLNTGRARFSPGGKFLGYIGSCLDITERKEAEQVLIAFSGELIRAREDERARIARELHDDLSQKIALVSIDLDQLGQRLPGSDGPFRGDMEVVLKQLNDISREIHRLSHNLHPSKLSSLGLVAAVDSLCDELQSSHNLKIEFSADGIPIDLSKDISLCLYRIVQECLNNVIKHSGAQNARVELRGTEKEIRLRVTDSGIGFVAESFRIKKGLGLVSMRERLRLVGGRISIRSHPSQGAQIDARVPLQRTGGRESSAVDEKRRFAASPYSPPGR